MAECVDNQNTSLSGSNPEQLGTTNPIINNDAKGVTGGVATGGGFIFDVNKMVSAMQSYQAINTVANEMFGYEFKWFRAVPQQRSKDVIFQEYTLSNVEECPLVVKAVLPSGNIPDSKYNYDLMGLEYELPFEIQIDKKYWESIAGFGTAPQKKDIVYFPMANKLFQVESSYLFRGFMEQETAWKINLRKYQPEASRKEPASLKDTIDIYTVSAEEIFGTAVDNEVKKLVDDQQFSQFNGTSEDKYKSFDVSLNTITAPISIYGTVVAESFYDLQSSAYYNALIYPNLDLITPTTNRAITAWIQPRVTTSKEYNVQSILPIIDSSGNATTLDPSTLYQYDASLYSSANYTITVNENTPIKLADIQIDNNIVISRVGALNLYAKVVAISNDPSLLFHCIINPFVLEDMIAIKQDWNIQKGYKLTIKEPISIIDGVNDFGEHVLSVNVYANQYIAISYGHSYADYNAYVMKMDERINDNQWYGIVVNIGNNWKQYNTYVWTQHESDKNAKLQNIFYETLRLYPEEIAVDMYTVNKSPAYLTNLRLFSSTIEEEKQANELLSYFSKDGDQLIISDNADPRLRLPYITHQR